MSGHTEGPWQVIGSFPSEGFDCFWINAQPSPELRGFTKNIGSINGPQSEPEYLANARLIAAAPELLDALKLLLRHSGLDIDAQDKDPEDHAAERVARAAIAKATGERK